MPSSKSIAKSTIKARPAYRIRNSPTHGRGAFAARTLRKGMKIVEYLGTRSTWAEVCERPDSDANDPYHTLLFETSDGMVIDAGLRGNAARFINHSCDPNCEAIEYERSRIFIHARKTVHEGEELTYDYRLSLDGKVSKRAQKAMECRCGTARCRGTMLAKAPKKKKKKK